MKNSKLVICTKWMLDILFVAGIVICLAVPFLMKLMQSQVRECRTYYWQGTVCFMVAGVLGLLILRELRHMFGTVVSGDPFVSENVTSLKRMGILSALIDLMILGLFLMFMKPTFLLMLLVFVVAGLFSLVLAQVFAKAVEYKLENDYTI